MKARIIIAAALICAVSCTKENAIDMLVGTYSGEGSEGVYAYRFDQEKGKLVGKGGLARLSNASYLCLSEDGSVMYAVSENGSEDAAIAAFNFKDGQFTQLGEKVQVDYNPCYVSTNGKLVLSANYTSGTLSVIKANEDGSLQGKVQTIPGTIGGPDMSRQETPHVHTAVFSPDGKYVFATDFSADDILRFEVAEDSLVTPATRFGVQPDSGPRHLVIRNGMLYSIGELSGTVNGFKYNDGNLETFQIIAADEVDARGSADIHISPDGRFLYASCRLENDGIAIFRIEEDGLLTKVGYQNTGIHPRNFNITPNGRFLLCACRDSNAIEVYAIDSKTGLLKDTGNRIEQSKPVCVIWGK